jgi:hypothetical protein
MCKTRRVKCIYLWVGYFIPFLAYATYAQIEPRICEFGAAHLVTYSSPELKDFILKFNRVMLHGCGAHPQYAVCLALSFPVLRIALGPIDNIISVAAARSFVTGSSHAHAAAKHRNSSSQQALSLSASFHWQHEGLDLHEL